MGNLKTYFIRHAWNYGVPQQSVWVVHSFCSKLGVSVANYTGDISLAYHKKIRPFLRVKRWEI